MKKIGIIGVGETVGIANYHEMGIRRDGRAKISALYDLNYENAVKWAKEKKLDCVIAKSLDEFYANVDAVDICTPNFTHLQYMLDAIAHGKDFFIEKPATMSLEDAKTAYEAVKGKGLVNMVGFIYRFSNLISKMKELVETKIGKVYTYTTYYGGKRLANPQIPLEWRFKRALSGTGAIGDFGSHVVDASINICGVEIEKVVALKNTFISERNPDRQGNTQVENDDACVFSAVAKSGTLLSYTVSRVGMDDMSILIAGEGGMLSCSIKTPDFITFWEKDKNAGYSGEMKLIPVESDTYYASWFEKEMSTFISALNRENVKYPDLKHSLEVEKVLSAVEQSSDDKVAIEI